MADELREGRLRRDYEKLDGRRPGQLLSDEMRAAGRRTMVAKSAERANELAPLIAELRAAGFRSRGAIADALTERGIPTARGCAEWSETQVARLLTKLARSASSASRAQVDSPPVGDLAPPVSEPCFQVRAVPPPFEFGRSERGGQISSCTTKST
jgi:hypothetical protein